jgi:lysine 2,3-aminomutase
MPPVSAPSEPWRVLYPDATADQWNDWRWQMRHAVHSVAELEKHLTLTDAERAGCRDTASIFRLGISPYYLSLIDRDHPYCPVRMQAIPVASEARIRPGELQDPLGEDRTRPVPAIVHRYPDRVLLLALDSCSTYCRHCTRRRITKGGEAELSRAELERGIQYIREHREVRDVLISGGDPFLLSEARLEELLVPLRAIPHVEMLRIGTRVPVCLPMRVTEPLSRLLRSHAPLFVVTHFNHPKEVTKEARAACELLVDHGVPVENQAVLLRRVNSEAHLIKELSHALLRARVRPYYLHQMDVAEGCEHLRTPLAKGVEILEALRGHTSGLAVPHLAVDLPGGGGKVTLQPEYVVERRSTETVFRNFRGETYRYPEPEETDCSCPYDEVWRRRPA